MARRSFPPWVLPLAIVATAVLLAALGLWQAATAYRLTLGLDGERTTTRIEHTLVAAYAGGDAAELQRATAALVADRTLGITYLAVTDAQGGVLAFDGRYEQRWASWLPAGAGARLREFAYRWSGEVRRLRPAGAGGIGEIRYLVSPGLSATTHDGAVLRLGIGGLLALLLSVLAAWAAALALRSSAVQRPAWLQRLDPDQRPPRPAGAADVEERVAELLRLRTGSLLDEVGRGIIVVDRDASILHLNATAERLTGWTLADVRGRLVYSVFHPQDERYSPLLTPAEICIRENRASPATEMRLRRRDGAQHPVEVMAMPMRRLNGSIDGAVMLFHDISEREGRADQLRRQARLSQGVIDHLVEGVLTTDPAGVIRFANARALRMFGYTREELDGVTVSKLMPVPFLNSPTVRLTDYIGAERSAALPTVVGWRRDASTFPVELVVQTMTIDQSQGLLLIVRDITERLRSENLAQRLGRLLDAATEEVYIFDAATLYFVEVNRGARRNLGYHPSEMTRMTPLTISQDLDTDAFLGYLGRLRSGEAEHVTYRCRHRRADGSGYPVEVRLNFSREEEPPVFMAIAVDITEREQAEERLRYLAHHDVLTGLPNRATLHDRLSQALLAARRSNRQVGVLFMDVDRFKSFNDSYGHEVGDAVLKLVATRLSAALRASDTVARLGGDEFVVVASGLRAESDALALARKIQLAFEPPLELPGQRLQVTLSIGIAICPVDDSDAENLLHHADLAMYAAKQAGPGQFRVHPVEVPPERRRRIALERGVHAAFALEQFHLRLSPVLAGGAVRAVVAGFEWRHPEYGAVAADEAMASARRAGLQSELELWRLAAAAALLPADAEAMPTIVVPLSGAQLRHPDFAQQLGELRLRYPAPQARLIVAVDADGLREAAVPGGGALALLRAAGLRIGLHDQADALIAALGEPELPALELVLLDAIDVAGDVPGEVVERALQLARERGVPLLVAGVDSTEAVAQLSALGCDLLAGAAIQPALDAVACRVWAAPRRGEPL